MMMSILEIAPARPHLRAILKEITMTVLSTFRLAVLPLAIFCVTPAFAAEDPTMHQVYLAAQAGKYEEAQAMMDKVLRDHPNSAKAHFVEAELLARQGRMIEAAPELAKAEKIAPGLPFAKPEAVSKLRAQIDGSAKSLSAANAAPVVQTQAPVAQAPRAAYSQREAAPREGGGIPWGMIIIIGIVAIIAYVIMGRRKAAQQGGGGGFGGGGGGGAPFIPQGPGSGGFGNSAQPQYPGYGGGVPMGGQQAPGMGMGSRIAGGLATGAAVGAGIVAGEALMHHFTDRDSGGNSNHANAATPPAPGYAPAQPDDMGGNDFGVADSGSWDDGGSGGGGGGGGGGDDDWN
jgi:hypothetical protein